MEGFEGIARERTKMEEEMTAQLDAQATDQGCPQNFQKPREV